MTKDGWPDGFMWNGSGDRNTIVHVGFDNCFSTDDSVKVVTSMSKIDTFTPPGYLGHFIVEVLNVKKCGFDLRFVTWGWTQVASAKAIWIAVGDQINTRTEIKS